ncbi:filamentous hemagglutinin N-terminal domain-containing protein [Salmonella enterica]|nr:filamentous hemagglutinin N-terminal domain-containing protein [Salmonella enterica]
MNKIYRLKFDRRRNELVAVSEITAGTGKEKNTGHIAGLCDVSTFRKLVGTLTPLAFLTGLIISLFPVVALANPDLPTGGQIVGGQGSISTSGNQMTIHQQTQNMATNWHSFDIGQNNTVQFVQPDSSSVALNRVTGASGSQIMGTLKANGQVFILNPNGVLFGKDARVSVAGLVASTKSINTADFMKGQYTLSGEGNPGAQVINQGSLTTTKGGYIVLAADQVKNSGTITTPSGKTVLAAGKTVTLQLDNGGLTSVSVDGSVVNALVENQGLISAADGRVFLTAQGKDMLLNTVVNNSGTIEAKGLESRGGEIVLNGGDSGVVNQTGQLLADSHAGPGGKITVEGQNIHLAANSRTSATGKTGGGEVYVGGGWQGKDSHIRNASKVVMDKTATVDVSATDAGSGGTAVLWSDDYTNFRGAILAKGGALSGDGGRVETSSHNNLQAFGDVDTSASAGHGGEWLLDPLDVTIVNGDANTGVTESGKGAGGATLDTGTDHVFSPSAPGAQVSAQKISDQLNNGTSVTVETHGDGSQAGNITFNADASVKKDKGSDATLTLKADRDISFEKRSWTSPGDTGNGAIVSTHGKLNLNLLTGNDGKNGAVGFKGFVRLHLNGGDAFIGPANTTSGNASVSFQNDDTIDAGNITLNTAGGVTGNNYGLSADKDLTVNGRLSLGVNSGVTSELKAGGLLKITAGTGDISFIVSGDNTRNKLLIEGKGGVDISADNGSVIVKGNKNVAKPEINSKEGDVHLSGTGGELTWVKISSLNTFVDMGSDDNQYSLFKIDDGEFSSTGDITVSVKSKESKAPSGTHDPAPTGLYLKGTDSFSGKNILIKAIAGSGSGAALTLGDQVTINFTGNTTIQADKNDAMYPGGLIPAAINSSWWPSSKININDGVLKIKAHAQFGSGIGAYLDSGQWADSGIHFHLNHASVDVEAKSDNGSGIFYLVGANQYQNGLTFSGDGNASVSASGGESGIIGSILDNSQLNGTFSVYGHGGTGNGIKFSLNDLVKLKDTVLKGVSDSGAGILIAAANGIRPDIIDLNGNKLDGNSDKGNAGVQVNGRGSPDQKGVVTITNGTIDGAVNHGTGTGVILFGKTNYTISGATVTGQSVDGPGVSAGGDLIVNNGTKLKGTATGTGHGVVISGDLRNTDESNVVIEGKAESGDGVQVAGKTSLNNTTVEGTSSHGTGTNIMGPLTVSGTSEIKGTSTSGTGLNIAGKVTVNEPDREKVAFTGTSTEKDGVVLGSSIEGGTVTGTSTSGNGVVLAENAEVKQAAVKGLSTEGKGVYVTGSNVNLIHSSLDGTTEGGKGAVIKGVLTQDENSGVSGNSEGQGTGMQLESKASVSGGALTATSVGGTGLQVEKGSSAENVVISAQTVTGKAIDGENGALTTTGTSISTVGEPGNTNISENAKPVPGGTPSGAVAEALGNKLSESISALQKTLDTKLADLDGLQQTMTTLQMQFDQAVRTGAIGQVDLKRLETAMNDLSVRLNTAAELKDAFGALKTDTGSLEERLKKSDALSTGLQALPAAGDIRAVAGDLVAAKNLQSATVSLQDSLAARTEEEGVVRHLLDSLQQQLKDAQEKETAGGTVLSGIQTQLESLGQQQRLYMEALTHIRQGLATVSQDDSIPVAGRQENVNRLQTALSGVSGVSGMQVRELGRQLQQAKTGYAQLVTSVQQQDSVNMQASSLTREVQEKYPEPLKDTMISVCTREDGCQSWSLNVSHPSAE